LTGISNVMTAIEWEVIVFRIIIMCENRWANDGFIQRKV
jgi:hypothetical protein